MARRTVEDFNGFVVTAVRNDGRSSEVFLFVSFFRFFFCQTRVVFSHCSTVAATGPRAGDENRCGVAGAAIETGRDDGEWQEIRRARHDEDYDGGGVSETGNG